MTIRELFDACCRIALDARGKAIEGTPHENPACCPAPADRHGL
jgi:hypothetical protein